MEPRIREGSLVSPSLAIDSKPVEQAGLGKRLRHKTRSDSDHNKQHAWSSDLRACDSADNLDDDRFHCESAPPWRSECHEAVRDARSCRQAVGHAPRDRCDEVHSVRGDASDSDEDEVEYDGEILVKDILHVCSDALFGISCSRDCEVKGAVVKGLPMKSRDHGDLIDSQAWGLVITELRSE